MEADKYIWAPEDLLLPYIGEIPKFWGRSSLCLLELLQANQSHPGGVDDHSLCDENHNDNSIAVFESEQYLFLVVTALALSEKAGMPAWRGVAELDLPQILPMKVPEQPHMTST